MTRTTRFASLLLTALLVTLGPACDRQDNAKKNAKKNAQQPANPGEESSGDDRQKLETSSLVADQLDRLRKKVDCSAEPSDDTGPKLWCIATEGWADGTAAALPEGEQALLGLTIGLEKDEPISKALNDTQSMSALLLRRSNDADNAAPMAKIVLVEPETEDERQMTRQAVRGLARFFKGGADSVPVPANLAGYLDKLPAQADSIARKGPHGWTWQDVSTARLRRVDDHWISVEIPEEEDAVYLSIFTDRLAVASGD